MSANVRRILLILGAVAAVMAMNARVAHADPMDTVAVQAAIVCSSLHENPTVDEIESQVARLNALYVPESENRVMAYAMNVMCPQYQYLAWAALKDIINSAPNTGGSTI